MPSSELSDALNPFAVQRTRTSIIEYTSTTQQVIYQPVVHAPQQYVPHRSELELAMLEPTYPPPRRTEVAQRLHSQQDATQAIQELLRAVSDTREAQEAERKRRLAWEQEQEAKAVERQAEVDRKMLKMCEEIASLREALMTQRAEASTRYSNGLEPHYNLSLLRPETFFASTQLVSPISPISQPSVYPQPAPVQSSSHNYLEHSQPMPCSNHEHVDNFRPTSSTEFQIPAAQQDQPSCDPPPQSATPGQNSQTSSESSHPTPVPAPTPPRSKKKRQTWTSSSETDSDTNSPSPGSKAARPRKRLNHHDKRCLTIQHAMRAHFWQMLGLDSDSKLPDSHVEGASADASDPIRFVWDKTTKQSVHNARMKARILSDIKENRQLYRHVPGKDFGKKILDAAFEQCFTTFRQKYRAQVDESVALQTKKREEAKARKARHLSRRKVKLNNRAEARMKIRAFEHVVFDAALQIECMSSEESDVEKEKGDGNHPAGILRTRGYAWRSSRLLHFYYALDQEEISDKSSKPKRGVGKKERLVGPPKEDALLPPKGVATWMISRRWFKTTQRLHPDLSDTLKNLVDESAEHFDSTHLRLLGEVSDVSDDEQHQFDPQQYEAQHPHMNRSMTHTQYHTSSSSLDYALMQESS